MKIYNSASQEFVHVLARVSNVKTNPEELMKNASTSGLVRYLFGADLSGSLKKEDFVKLQADLISDVLEMEFARYAEDTTHNISETDFCRHLLYSSSISQKKVTDIKDIQNTNTNVNTNASQIQIHN